MNDAELQQITRQLADVELPAPPDWQPTVVAAIVVATAVLLAIGLIYLRSRRGQSAKLPIASREALYQLRRLQQAWQRNEIDDHDTAYRLATLLRLGLGLNQLTETPPAPLMSEEPQWQTLLQQLAQLRYRPQPDDSGAEFNQETQADEKITEETFNQIAQWLQRGHAPC